MSSQVVWLKATYEMPSTYSIRVPMSAPLSAKALPTPGPATVQLAMIKVAIELYGVDATRRELFQHIVARNPMLQPPEQVAFSTQVQRLYKADDTGASVASIGYREFCHCEGPMCIFVAAPLALTGAFDTIMRAIGSMGQGNSFASCVEVTAGQPLPGHCARKFSELPTSSRVKNYFSALATELDRPDVGWTDIVVHAVPHSGEALVRPKLYVWPLVKCVNSGTSERLQFCSFH